MKQTLVLDFQPFLFLVGASSQLRLRPSLKQASETLQIVLEVDGEVHSLPLRSTFIPHSTVAAIFMNMKLLRRKDAQVKCV